MSNLSKWIVRAMVVALVLFGAAFARLDGGPGAHTAEARASSAVDASLSQVAVRATRTTTATKTATATKTTTSTSTTVNGNDAACLNAQETAFLGKINAYRTSKGLKTLVATKSLNSASYKHSLDMGVNNYFSHTSPNGLTFSQRMAVEGYTYATVKGENIAAGYSTADAVFNAWQASSGHNANMLNPNYTAIGIGLAVVPGSKYSSYWTTDFGGVVDATPACQ